jgi:hypothetical protein
MITKNIALSMITISLIGSILLLGMDYTGNQPHPITAKLESNIIASRSWIDEFIDKCQRIGIFAAIATSLGIYYSFKEITGLDYDKLDTYSVDELQNAKTHVLTRIRQKKQSQQLDDFFNKLEFAILNKTAPSAKKLSPEQAAAITEINKTISE